MTIQNHLDLGKVDLPPGKHMKRDPKAELKMPHQTGEKQIKQSKFENNGEKSVAYVPQWEKKLMDKGPS